MTDIKLILPDDPRLNFDLIDKFGTSSDFEVVGEKENNTYLTIRDPHLFLDNFDFLKNYLLSEIIHPLYYIKGTIIFCKKEFPFIYGWDHKNSNINELPKFLRVIGGWHIYKSSSLFSIKDPIIKKLKNIFSDEELYPRS